MLVVDASAAVDLCLSVGGFATLADEELHAPPLIRSESLAALHEMRWRGEVPEEMTVLGMRRRRDWPIAVEAPAALYEEAWEVAEEFGWAKTYDAEYVALARLLGCRLLTTDERLSRGARRLGFVVTPAEL